VTDSVGRNADPMWGGDTVLFHSDRSLDGITNLWAQDLRTGATRQVTTCADFDVMSPPSDGKAVVVAAQGPAVAVPAGAGLPPGVGP